VSAAVRIIGVTCKRGVTLEKVQILHVSSLPAFLEVSLSIGVILGSGIELTSSKAALDSRSDRRLSRGAASSGRNYDGG
jgi:hypothetical protein